MHTHLYSCILVRNGTKDKKSLRKYLYFRKSKNKTKNYIR